MGAPGAGGTVWLTAALLACDPSAAEQQPPDGRWTAEARMGPEAMTLLLDLEQRNGQLGGRISVPAERVLGLRVENFESGDGAIAFRIPHPDHPMEFAGRLAAERRLEGELSRWLRERDGG